MLPAGARRLAHVIVERPPSDHANFASCRHCSRRLTIWRVGKSPQAAPAILRTRSLGKPLTTNSPVFAKPSGLSSSVSPVSGELDVRDQDRKRAMRSSVHRSRSVQARQRHLRTCGGRRLCFGGSVSHDTASSLVRMIICSLASAATNSASCCPNIDHAESALALAERLRVVQSSSCTFPGTGEPFGSHREYRPRAQRAAGSPPSPPRRC